jgi:hypothetical protein
VDHVLDVMAECLVEVAGLVQLLVHHVIGLVEFQLDCLGHDRE